MTNRQFKEDFIKSLYDRGVYIRQVNDIQYVTRCPKCGDSYDITKGHFYIRVNPQDNFPIVYCCFKCDEKGVLDAETLSELDIDDSNMKAGLISLNKTSDKIGKGSTYNDIKNINFDYELPKIKIGPKTEYVENRLGIKLNMDDFKKMQLITSLKDFLVLNKIEKITCNPYIASKFEDHYVGFLSNGASHILFRDITDTEKMAWVKYPITKDSYQNRVFYSMSALIDIFTEDELVINLGEGVMDILSCCYNLDNDKENVMNIAVTGKYYTQVINYIISKGILGDNVTINLYSDNDEKFGKKKGKQGQDVNKSTTLEYYKKLLGKYKCLFKEINIYYNQIGKDIGVSRDKIRLKRNKL